MPPDFGFQRPVQGVVECADFVENRAPQVRWLSGFGRSNPFWMVSLDSPVRLAIWCSENLSRKHIRRNFPNISMLITLFLLLGR